MSDDILCFGEILWDALPDGLFLGGAPFNVACHLHALGEPVAFVSRVGDDTLGDEATRRLTARGLKADLLQIDDSLPTGFVRVDFDATGEPDYGSLAQRMGTTRQTLHRLWELDVVCVYDVNLRSPYDDRAVVEPSLRAADIVKLNDAELRRLRDWFGLPDGPEAAMAALGDTFDCSSVCVTWGGDGARLWREGAHTHHPGHPADVADTVGAGDAFLAALLCGGLQGREAADMLDLANRLGAYVASHSGAFPDYAVDGLDDLAQLPVGASTPDP
jgi:fructokinase